MLRAIDKWLPGYLKHLVRRPRGVQGPCDLMFCVADHYEPFVGRVAAPEAMDRVRRWASEYPRQVDGHRDADGMSPRHTFFYPAEDYHAPCLDELVSLCRAGHGEVEVHLHHRNDTPDGLREKLRKFREALSSRHGCLGRDAAGNSRFAFIHGNWALCNSRPDGDWCGVNQELGILRDAGCFVDMTFPSAPSPTQTRHVNTIWRACDHKEHPRSFDRGVPVRAGSGCSPEHDRETLMLIGGPLALNWRRRKWGMLPRVETGDLTGANPPGRDRVDLWLAQHIHVPGRPEWVFIKVHTHGCDPRNIDALLGEAMQRMWQHLEHRCNDGHHWRLHYVSAREMFNIVRAAEDGRSGSPHQYRDYAILPPHARGRTYPSIESSEEYKIPRLRSG